MNRNPEEAAEFYRRRNCSRCGRRLVYSSLQVPDGWDNAKRCPVYDDEPEHDLLRYRHPYPYRDRRGHTSRGTRRRNLLKETHD